MNETHSQKVKHWIADNFHLSEITISDFPLFPSGQLIKDKNGDTMVVFYDLMKESVDYVFPDK